MSIRFLCLASQKSLFVGNNLESMPIKLYVQPKQRLRKILEIERPSSIFKVLQNNFLLRFIFYDRNSFIFKLILLLQLLLSLYASVI
ncbi:unnamed protein product [Schistosoma intercalatum]|nr:unnamed protein product [Schistosoma intercalatum]